MSDADRMGLAMVKEASFGIAPGTQMTNVRFTSESLKQDTTSTASEEIRADRQTPAVFRVGVGASGDVNCELSYGSYDDWLASALQAGAWGAAVVVDTADTDISAAAADNSFNHTTGWAITPTVGKWIKVSGFATAGNNGLAKVVSATSTKIIVSGLTLTNEAATPAITITQGQFIENGTTFDSYTLEKAFTDLTNEFAQYHGMGIDQLQITAELGSIMTATFSFIGQDEKSNTVTEGTGTNAAAPTTTPMNVVDNILAVIEGGSIEDCATQFSLQLQNNLRGRECFGKLGAQSVGSGKLSVTGTLQMYFESKTIMDKYLNFSSTSLALKLQDAAGNQLIIDLPEVRFTTGQRVAGGESTDIIADLAFQAIMHPTEVKTIRLTRFAA